MRRERHPERGEPEAGGGAIGGIVRAVQISLLLWAGLALLVVMW